MLRKLIRKTLMREQPLRRLTQKQETGVLPDYGVTYVDHNIPTELPVKTVWGAWVHLKNCGGKTWQLHHPDGKRIDLVVDFDGQVWSTHCMTRAEVRPGEKITVHFPLRIPNAYGVHQLVLDLVEQNVTRFSDQGVLPLRLELVAKAGPISPSAELYELASRTMPWYYQPTHGVALSNAGTSFPMFVSRASGCRLWDLEGREYIDYVMGWGCALLGYAEKRVQQAVMAALDSGAIVPFPHPLEIEVAHMLTEDIPCADMIMFGKNGSDVCTLAARIARVFTGRKIILYCGYHGWQDWWAEQAGFAATGIPDRSERLIHPFKFNDLPDFMRLFERYRKDVAAIMLEPAGRVEGIQGPSYDTNQEFLRAIAAVAHDAGSLLIYDEIITGFRYPGGSVQKATGVIPDLACFGKALSAGMPLSALVGRAHILQRAMGQTHYGPTFRGEVYSLAAAKAALQIYRNEPVAEHVWNYGNRLKEGINRLCGEINVAAECIGPPFRTLVAFYEDDAERLSMKRTLYHQELLKAGVTTYDGTMLPSYAHDEEVLKTTLDAVGCALDRVARAERTNDFHRQIEIPLL